MNCEYRMNCTAWRQKTPLCEYIRYKESFVPHSIKFIIILWANNKMKYWWMGRCFALKQCACGFVQYVTLIYDCLPLWMQFWFKRKNKIKPITRKPPTPNVTWSGLKLKGYVLLLFGLTASCVQFACLLLRGGPYGVACPLSAGIGSKWPATQMWLRGYAKWIYWFFFLYYDQCFAHFCPWRTAELKCWFEWNSSVNFIFFVVT